MRQKCFFILVLILSIFCLTSNVFAASPSATLTVDGTLVETYQSVQEAVYGMMITQGDNFIIEIADGTVTDPLNILQQPYKNVVIRPQSGATVTFTNTITVDGNENFYHPETLLIQGLNFDLTSGDPEECIYFNYIPPRNDVDNKCYPHNITINGCNFKGVFDKTVAVQSVRKGSRNIAIMNCTATDMHSLAQLKAVSGYAFIQNCILSNSAGGVNFYGTRNLVVDSCKFDVEGYAVRSGQDQNQISYEGSVLINNSVLNSSSSEDGTIILRGDSTNNINIVHSNISNANGPVLQNLNQLSTDLYSIKFVESNVEGQIDGINLSTINTIDDPNVQNGPISINTSDNNNTVLIVFLVITLIVLLILIFLYSMLLQTRRET